MAFVVESIDILDNCYDTIWVQIPRPSTETHNHNQELTAYRNFHWWHNLMALLVALFLHLKQKLWHENKNQNFKLLFTQ